MADIDSWQGIVNNYLKAENLEGKDSFIVSDVRIVDRTTDAGVTRPQIEITTNLEGEDYIFSLNATNTKFVKSNTKSPKDLMGKKLFWEKVRVQNPQTKEMVNGINLIRIE